MIPTDKFKTLFNNPIHTTITLLVFLLPIGIAAIKHWSTSIAYALIFLSIFHVRDQWQKMDKHEKWIVIGFTLYFAAAMLSFVNTQDWSQSIKRLGKITWFIGFIPIFLAIRSFDFNFSRYFLTGILFSGPLNMGVALYDIEIENLTYATGAYNLALLGDMAILWVLISVSAIATNYIQRAHIPLVLISVGCNLYAWILAGSKTAWFVALISLPLFLWLIRKQLSKKKILIIACSLLLCTVGLYFTGKNVINNRLMHFANGLSHTLQGDASDGTVGIRYLMWKIAITTWLKNPILGSGLGDYQYDAGKQIEDGRTELWIVASKAHNIYLEALATTGIVGFSAMLFGLFILPFRYFYVCWKSCANSIQAFSGLAGIMCLTAYAIFGMTQSWFSRNYHVVPFVICLVVFLASCKADKSENLQRDKFSQLLSK